MRWPRGQNHLHMKRPKAGPVKYKRVIKMNRKENDG